MKFLSKSVRKIDSTENAVKELKQQFTDFSVRLLVYFASYDFDGDVISGAMQNAFPGAVTLGCSSHAELGDDGIQRNSLSALAFGDGALDALGVAVAENLSGDPDAVDKAFASIERQMGRKMLDFEFRTHFGMSLFDGSSPGIDSALERVGDLTNIVFIGGSASDDISMRRIRLYHNGAVLRDAAIFAVLKPHGPFALLKTQSVVPVGPKYVVTKVAEDNKLVLEFDGVPARDALARGIGVAPGELRAEHFREYSFGIMAEGEPFVRSGIGVPESGGLLFFNTIREGQRLILMRAGDIVEDTRIVLAAKRRALGGISAILDFDCAYRDLNLCGRGAVDDYAKLFTGVEAAGFATFGELFIANVNQTSVMALFA